MTDHAPRHADIDPDPQLTFSVSTPDGWDRARRWMVTYRKSEGLTQVEVARRMGVTRDKVRRFESGQTDPYISTVAGYVRAVGLHVQWAAEPRQDQA